MAIAIGRRELVLGSTATALCQSFISGTSAQEAGGFFAGKRLNVIVGYGTGGGFDVYAGLPLAHALWRRGQTVHLANLSFTNLVETDAAQITPDRPILAEMFAQSW